MKKITLFAALLALLASCSEKELIEEQRDPFLKVTVSDSTNLALQTANANPYNLLGHGYDATGFFFNALSGKAKVLDIEKLIELHPGNFSRGNYNVHDSKTWIGYSAEDLAKRLSVLTESSLFPINDSSKWNMFCGQFSSVFDHSELVSDKYMYGMYEEYIFKSFYTYYGLVDTLKSHLTEAFQTDVRNETPEFILNKYGTHVLTNVQLGGKIQVLYKTLKPTTEPYWNTQVGLSRAVLFLFSQSMSVSFPNETFDNREQETFAATSGGTRMKPWQGIVSTDTITKALVDITPWFESINENYSLIGVNEGHMIPLYELVNDEAKRTAIRSAYNTYFLKSKETLLKP